MPSGVFMMKDGEAASVSLDNIASFVDSGVYRRLINKTSKKSSSSFMSASRDKIDKAHIRTLRSANFIFR